MLTWPRKEEYYKNKKIKKCVIIYKMCEVITAFGDTEVEKHKFYQHKDLI